MKYQFAKLPYKFVFFIHIIKSKRLEKNVSIFIFVILLKHSSYRKQFYVYYKAYIILNDNYNVCVQKCVCTVWNHFLV